MSALSPCKADGLQHPPKIPNPMERLIITIMEAVSAINSSPAKIYQIIPVDHKIHILESYKRRVTIAPVDKIKRQLPVFHII